MATSAKQARSSLKTKEVKSLNPTDYNNVKDLVEFYKTSGLPIEKVQFFNGRVWRHTRPPHVTGGYRDESTGLIVNYADCVVYDLNGDRIMIPTKDGNDIPKRYGQPIKFKGNATIELHPITHFDLIKAIRHDSDCATPHKSSGYREVLNGKIVEFAPEVMTKREYNKYKTSLRANITLGTLLQTKHKRVLRYILALTENTFGSYEDKVLNLGKYVENNPKAFLDYFSDISPEGMAIKPAYINHAIVKLAVSRNVISRVNEVYFIGDVPLGVSAAKIPMEYEKHMGIIGAELDRVLATDGE